MMRELRIFVRNALVLHAIDREPIWYNRALLDDQDAIALSRRLEGDVKLANVGELYALVDRVLLSARAK